MKISPLSLSQYLVRLGRDQRGVSAVEFAMLLPLMITLYLGVVEISQAVGIDRKVTLTTRTVADLASQVTSITNADMTNLLGASSSVISPYDATPAEGHGIASGYRRERRRQDQVERHARRHQTRAVNRRRDAAGRAQSPEHVADLERGGLHLQAGDRLCRDRHAQSLRPDLHAAAALQLGRPRSVIAAFSKAGFLERTVLRESGVLWST